MDNTTLESASLPPINAVNLDVTHHELLEQSLSGNQEFFSALFEHAMVGMATTSVEKGWILVNPALCTILGLSKEELISKTWVELTHPDDLATDTFQFERLLRDESDGYSLEKRFIRPDGTIVHTLTAIKAVRSVDRNIRFFAVIVEDISEHKAVEESLTQSLQVTQQFLDHLPGTAYVKDENLRVVMANKVFQNLLGMDPSSMIGKSNTELFPNDFGRKLDADDHRVLKSGLSSSHVDESFEGRFFESSKFVIQDDSGRKLLGGITMEVTERQRFIELQEVLFKISELGCTLPEKEFLNKGLEMIERLTLSQIGFIHFINEEQECIELASLTPCARTSYSAAQEGYDPIGAAGIWADCARDKKIAIFNDYSGYRSKKGLPQNLAPLQRLISVPIIEEGKVRLIISIGNKATDYDEFDGSTVQIIGNDLWRIVRRVRAEALLKQNQEEMTALNVRFDEINNKLLHSEKLASLGQIAAGSPRGQQPD
ncbi:MAG: PAS domain S-box protein [Betaproteobacteria bacterium]